MLSVLEERLRIVTNLFSGILIMPATSKNTFGCTPFLAVNTNECLLVRSRFLNLSFTDKDLLIGGTDINER